MHIQATLVRLSGLKPEAMKIGEGSIVRNVWEEVEAGVECKYDKDMIKLC